MLKASDVRPACIVLASTPRSPMFPRARLSPLTALATLLAGASATALPQESCSRASASAESEPGIVVITPAATAGDARRQQAAQAAYPALQFLPKEVKSFAATAPNDESAALVERLFAEVGLKGVRSVAVGLTRGSEDALVMAADALLARRFQEEPRGSLLHTLAEIGERQARISPIYVVLECRAETSFMLQMLPLLPTGEGSGISRISCGALRGLRLDLGKAALRYLTLEEDDKREAERLSGRCLDVIICPRGDYTIIALADDAQDIRLPETAQEAVCPDEFCDFPKQAAGDDASPQPAHFFLCRIDARPLRRLSSSLISAARRYGTELREQLADARAADPAHRERLRADADRLLQTLVRLLEPTSVMTEPLVVQLWDDGGAGDSLYVALSADACGHSFLSVPLEMRHMAEHPGMLLYAESAPLDSSTRKEAADVADLTEQLVHRVAEKDSRASAAEARDDSALYRSLRPALRAMGRAFSSMFNSLEGAKALVVQSSPGEAGLSVAVHSPVASRQGLSEGWERFLDALDGSIRGLGMNPDVINSLPMALRDGPEGSAAYSLLLPVRVPGFSPNVLVSNTDLVLGSNEQLNRQVIESLAESSALPGAVFQLNFEKALELMRIAESEPRGGVPSPLQIPPFVRQHLEQLAEHLRSVSGLFTAQDGKAELHLRLRRKR